MLKQLNKHNLKNVSLLYRNNMNVSLIPFVSIILFQYEISFFMHFEFVNGRKNLNLISQYDAFDCQRNHLNFFKLRN